MRTPEFESEATEFLDGPLLESVSRVTEAQSEIWLADRLSTPASLAFNESITLRLSGAVDVEALRAAFGALVARHESLRTTIGADGADLLIHPATPIDVPMTDLRGDLSARGILAQAKSDAVRQPFNLTTGPLFRVDGFRTADDEYEIVLTAHHIVCDGWSWGVIVRDLAALYNHQLGHPADAGATQYREYVMWAAQEASSPDMAGHEQFWLSQFSSGDIPVLHLPTDRLRPSTRTFPSARRDRTIGADIIEPLKTRSKQLGVSLFSTLLAAFAHTLERVSGQDELIVGVPVAGQMVSGLGAVVGHCVNLLPIRLAVDRMQTVEAAVRDTSHALLNALEHQSMTFGTLLKKLPVDRDPRRLPLVQVMFNFEQGISPASGLFHELKTEVSVNPRAFENFEMFLNVVQIDDQIRFECQYNIDLFDGESVERWLDIYASFLRAFGSDATALISGAPWVSTMLRDEAAAMQVAPSAFPEDELLHTAFLGQAALAPGRVAISFDGVDITYGDLAARANQLARELRRRSIARGDRVGICLERTPDLIVAVLAVLQSGAAYVPLDPSFPSMRLSYYAEDAGLSLLITTSSIEQAPRRWRTDAADRILNLDIDSSWTEEARDALHPSTSDATPNDPAYIIYTSGSTGKPKGVAVHHRAVVNFLTSMRSVPSLAPDDRLAAVTTLSFDIAVLELWLPLSTGARIVLVPDGVAVDGRQLRQLIERHSVNVMQATPGLWQILIEAGWKGSRQFTALVGGEALPPQLATALLERAGSVWNMYGPTETTVWSTMWKVDAAAIAQRGVAIGRPIANTTVWILDSAQQLCPVGVPGEICIGGAGVTLGYHGRPELTSERFIPDPFDEGGRLYRTGDRGRWRNDRLVEHLGRLDTQVKVRGYRIELSEIEAVCRELPAVAECVVSAVEVRPGELRLVAYLVGAAIATVDVTEIRTHVGARLPGYMVPQHFIELPVLPRLPNGKLDRKALPSPLDTQDAASTRVEPRTERERIVVEAMENALSLARLSIHDNFFLLGGHSLIAARLLTQLSQALAMDIPFRAIFEAPTPAQLAAWVDANAVNAEASVVTPIQAQSTGAVAPTSLMQQRLWFLEQMEPGRPASNTPSAHRLRGPLDVASLERAFNEVVRRQSALRTYIDVEAGVPYQRVVDSLHVELQPVEDLSSLHEAARESALLQRLDELVVEHIDVGAAPLFRARLFRLSADEHVLFFMPHHMIWDGWSFDLFYREMASLYESFTSDRPVALPPLATSYGDFAAWQQEWLGSKDLERQLSQWQRWLADPPAPLDLPTDFPRPARRTGGGATLPVSIGADVTTAARELSKRADATLFMTLLAVYSTLLHDLTGQTDLVVGTPWRGRRLPEVENVMGFFVNALPLRIRIDPAQSFFDLLGDVRRVALEAFSTPDVPIEHLIRVMRVPRDESRPPLYQTFLSYQDARDRILKWGDIEHRRIDVFQRGSADDLGLWLVEDARGLVGGLAYNTDIVTVDRVRSMWARFEALLNAVLASPKTAVGDLRTSFNQERRLEAVAAEPKRQSTRAIESPAEKMLAEIWAELLGVTAIRPSDNFFDLGGHSLLAAQVVDRIHARFNVQIDVRRVIFETLEQIASSLGDGHTRPPVIPSSAPAQGWFSRLVGKRRDA